MKITIGRKKQTGDSTVNLNFEKMLLQLSRSSIWNMEDPYGT